MAQVGMDTPRAPYREINPPEIMAQIGNDVEQAHTELKVLAEQKENLEARMQLLSRFVEAAEQFSRTYSPVQTAEAPDRIGY